MTTEKILIGGQALRELGSPRHTEDMDYLVFIEDDYTPFHTSKNVDYINANSSNFFEAIWKKEKGNKIASPNSLLELKGFAYVQHLINGNFAKAKDCEFDIKFLVENCGVSDLTNLKKTLSFSEFQEVNKLIK